MSFFDEDPKPLYTPPESRKYKKQTALTEDYSDSPFADRV